MCMLGTILRTLFSIQKKKNPVKYYYYQPSQIRKWDTGSSSNLLTDNRAYMVELKI